jgi:hypothetical protein
MNPKRSAKCEGRKWNEPNTIGEMRRELLNGMHPKRDRRNAKGENGMNYFIIIMYDDVVFFLNGISPDCSNEVKFVGSTTIFHYYYYLDKKRFKEFRG